MVADASASGPSYEERLSEAVVIIAPAALGHEDLPPPPPPSEDEDPLVSSLLPNRAASLSALEAACLASELRRQQPMRRAKSLLSAKEHMQRYGGEEPRLRGSPFGACYVESFLIAIWQRLRGTLPEPETSSSAVGGAAGKAAAAATEPEPATPEPATNVVFVPGGGYGGSDERSTTAAYSSWNASAAGSNADAFSAFSLSSLQGLDASSEAAAATDTQTINLGSLPGDGVAAALAVAAKSCRDRDGSTYEEEGGDASDAGGSDGDGASTVQYEDIFPLEVEDCRCRWCSFEGPSPLRPAEAP